MATHSCLLDLRSLALAILCLPCSLARGQVNWVERHPAHSPDGGDAVIALDAMRGKVLLLDSQCETWEWDGVDWIHLTPTQSPPCFFFGDGAMAYTGTEILLFGGWGLLFGHDMWLWDGIDWREFSPDPRPAPRWEHPMAYDSVRSRVVLFGGGRGDGGSFGDTWEWDGVKWVKMSPPKSPSRRQRHAMAFDQLSQRTVLFGGGENVENDETWEWDGNTWIFRNPAHRPPARAEHAMIYDQARQRVILFGGIGRDGSLLSDTWEWDGTDWMELVTSSIPPSRFHHSMEYDIRCDTVLLFGGWGYSNGLSDTWVLRDNRISGRVVFDDGETPVRIPGTPPSSIWAIRRGATGGKGSIYDPYTANVDENSSYTFSDAFPPGDYDIIAAYTLGSRHGFFPGYSSVVLQPFDLSTNPDLTVSPAGVPDKVEVDIAFPWPALLLHGVNLIPWGEAGIPFDFLQPFLANADLREVLSSPRRGVIPLVPDMAGGRLGPVDYFDHYLTLSDLLPSILALFNPATKFNVCSFSQGGLVARILLNDPSAVLQPERIKRVIQVATPNTGSCVAYFDPQVPWLTPFYMNQFNAVYRYGHGKPIYQFAGTEFVDLSPFNTCLLFEGDGRNDSIVSVESVFSLSEIPGYKIALQIPAPYAHSGFLGSATHILGDTSVTRWVHGILAQPRANP